MDIEQLTGKYTGVPIGHDALAARHRQGGIAAALAITLPRAAQALAAAAQPRPAEGAFTSRHQLGEPAC